MSEDRRILEYQKVIQALLEDRLPQDVPIGSQDAIGDLGGMLMNLSKHLEFRFIQEEKLLQISEQINKGLFLEEVLNQVYDSFRTLIPYDRIGCSLLIDDQSMVRAFWSRAENVIPRLKAGFTAPLAGSSLETILKTGKPRILNDLEVYLREHPGSVSTRLIVEEGFRSSFTCPLNAMGKPVGFLFFSSLNPNTYADIHQGIFLRLASQLSMIIEKSRLYQQLHELNRELKAARDALEIQATHDALTGVFNRGAILEIVGKHLSRAKREHTALALALTDLDHFKNINDSYGHQTGDTVLREAAERIARSIRESDYVGRYGGEEFLVLLHPGHRDQAAQIGERIRHALNARPIRSAEHTLSASLSLGMVVIEGGLLDPSYTVERIVGLADAALYRAKAAGRNRIEVAYLSP